MTVLPLVHAVPSGRLSRVQGDPAQLEEAVRSARAAWPIALVAMPFNSICFPSIQIGLLKAIAASHGFPASTLHLNLDFAQQIGPPLYEGFTDHRRRLFGDWLFSLAAFGAAAPDPDDLLLDAFCADVEPFLAELGTTREHLQRIRHEEVPRYLDRLIDTVPWGKFRVVGFSSTFQQNAAVFALAARIKRRFPEVVLLFGGANFEGEMGREFVRTIACIDYAILGEGDLAFPEFLIALQEGRDAAEVPGVVCRREGVVTALRPRPLFRQMDELPVPDYAEYFERAASLGLFPSAPRRVVNIPFESARGCWWGEKQHCTFCGLNGLGMAYRSKSPRRLVDELTELARRHRSFRFQAVDNIVDLAYLKSFFPRLAAHGFDGDFFYEVKSNLTREQIKVLYDGGVRRVQPGIESLSSHALKRMRKGVTALQNINTLRWLHYYGIETSWNLLWGFPGETEEEYRGQQALFEQIPHLPPPVSAGRIWMERFSPIFFDRDAFPTRYLRPEASHRYVYPREVDLERVAYFFDYEFEDTLPDAAYEAIYRQVRTWQAAWKETVPPALTFWSAPGFLQIEDRREPDAPGTYTFEGPLAALYAACSDRPHSAPRLRSLLGLTQPVDAIAGALERFCARGLMMRERESFLSLALPAVRGR